MANDYNYNRIVYNLIFFPKKVFENEYFSNNFFFEQHMRFNTGYIFEKLSLEN